MAFTTRTSKDSQKYSQTQPLFVLLGWSAQTNLKPFIFLSSLSDENVKSK